ncbi:hypothetical protein ACFW6V_36035 [Streptomyces sp. NPDC058734]|uniref:hypothetical protein n=1 Tax=Streptomyces sp. NPDC058734 TaxID=3346615 RepID=UPI0036AC810A
MNATALPPAISTTLVEIAAHANSLCRDLADEQFATAARIRALAENVLTENGES